MPLASFIENMSPAIEMELQTCVAFADGDDLSELYQMLKYHLGWEGVGAGFKAQGKRIRPLLLLLTNEATGGEWKRALPASASVELVHNFSLIHDDIQDKSEIRRGRSTVWKKWGKAQAINAGDSMFALAHIALQRLENTIPTSIIHHATEVMRTACLTLTQGQYLDLAYEGRGDLTTDSYWPMVTGKTASLLAACVEIGAILGGVEAAGLPAYREFGINLGLAFQVHDDLLGIWGDATITGKSAEMDLLSGKKSLPILYALEKNGLFADRWKQGNIQSNEVADLSKTLEAEGAKIYAQKMTNQLTLKALHAFETTNPTSEAAKALIEMANQLMERED